MKLLTLLLVALTAGALTCRAADGDPERGARVYQRCAACHAMDHDRSGPRHCGLFGRRAGSVPGYPYSKAMTASGLTWDEATLDRFLENPLRALPGTKMAYAGVKEPAARADLIAYLRQASRDPAICD